MFSKTKSVLVVEDEAKLARLLEDYLANAGYQSHWLANGVEVVDWTRTNTPD